MKLPAKLENAEKNLCGAGGGALRSITSHISFWQINVTWNFVSLCPAKSTKWKDNKFDNVKWTDILTDVYKIMKIVWEFVAKNTKTTFFTNQFKTQSDWYIVLKKADSIHLCCISVSLCAVVKTGEQIKLFYHRKNEKVPANG